MKKLFMCLMLIGTPILGVADSFNIGLPGFGLSIGNDYNGGYYYPPIQQYYIPPTYYYPPIQQYYAPPTYYYPNNYHFRYNNSWNGHRHHDWNNHRHHD